MRQIESSMRYNHYLVVPKSSGTREIKMHIRLVSVTRTAPIVDAVSSLVGNEIPNTDNSCFLRVELRLALPPQFVLCSNRWQHITFPTLFGIGAK